MLKLSVFLATSVAVSGCIGEKGKVDDTGAATTDSGKTDTEDTVSQDTGCPEPGTPDAGQSFDLDDSELNVSLGDKTFSGTQGHWNVRSQRCISSLTSTKLLGAVNQNITIEVYGDISGAGTYPIRSFSYSENEAQAGSTFDYNATDPGVNLVVTGYANSTYLYASGDGTFQAIDSISGGAATLNSLVIENWPLF